MIFLWVGAKRIFFWGDELKKLLFGKSNFMGGGGGYGKMGGGDENLIWDPNIWFRFLLSLPWWYEFC